MRNLLWPITKKALWQWDDSYKATSKHRETLWSGCPKAALQPGRSRAAQCHSALGARNQQAETTGMTRSPATTFWSSGGAALEINSLTIMRFVPQGYAGTPWLCVVSEQVLLIFTTAQGFCTIPSIPPLLTLYPSPQNGLSPLQNTEMPGLKG